MATRPYFPFHITRHGSNILGLDVFMSLDFSLLDNKGAQILTVSCPWQQEWPTLFVGLVCLTAFTYQPLSDPTIKPAIQPPNLTAFIMHTGVFRYTRVPFGLGSAPSSFQKMMSTILAGVPGTAMYLEDVIVYTPNAVIHEQRLRATFVAFTQHNFVNLTLNMDKYL